MFIIQRIGNVEMPLNANLPYAGRNQARGGISSGEIDFHSSPPFDSTRRRASSLIHPLSGKVRAHSAAVTSRATCQCGVSRQSKNLRNDARIVVDALRSNSLLAIEPCRRPWLTTAL